MAQKKTKSHSDQQPTTTARPSPIAWLWRTLLAGTAFVLPIVLMVAIFHYIYLLVDRYLVQPFGQLVVASGYENEFLMYWSPVISLFTVVLVLFVCGLLFRTRLRQWVDWAMGKVPGVATLYNALRDTARALQGPPGLESVDTVVLVPFPHGNARMAGYLMAKMDEAESGRALACVYVPIVLFPPSGYTIIIPEDEVVYTDWPTKDVWKLLLSGGLTLPGNVPFAAGQGEQNGKPAIQEQQPATAKS